MALSLNKYKHYIKQIIVVALPIVLSQLSAQITSIADTIMVGHISKVHLGAAAISTYLFWIPYLFGLGLSMAVTPVVGKANGEGNEGEVKRLFVDSIYFSILIAIGVTGLMLLLGLLLPYINSDAELVKIAIPYYNWNSLSFFSIALLGGFKQHLDGIKFTSYGMIANILGNIINIFLNWVFIFGNLGAPRLELYGAGLATCISRFFALFFIIFIVCFSKRIKNKIQKPSIKLFSFSRLRVLFKVGTTMGIQSSLEMAAFSVVGFLAGGLGTLAIASYNITQNIVTLFYLGIIGIAAANTIIVSNYIGSNSKQEVQESCFCMLLVTLFITFCSVTLILLSRNLIPQLYTNDAEVLKIVPVLLLFAAGFHIPDAIAGSLLGILRGFVNIKIPTIIQVVSYWGFMIPFIYLVAFKLKYGVYGLTFSLIIGIGLCCILLYIWFRHILKKYMES
ncbi:MAG: MATE family efflux transporter [Bacteroidetes bacterium]|nr:MATE family efflux transporter [Bacteroidota bacterium]